LSKTLLEFKEINGPFNFVITIYFGSINPYKNNDGAQQIRIWCSTFAKVVGHFLILENI
jgi:hypothetical protein